MGLHYRGHSVCGLHCVKQGVCATKSLHYRGHSAYGLHCAQQDVCGANGLHYKDIAHRAYTVYSGVYVVQRVYAMRNIVHMT